MITLKKMIKNKAVYFLFFINAFFAYSCKDNNAESSIAGKEYKLWQRLDVEEKQRGTVTYYYFDRSGKFQYFKKYKNSKQIVKLDIEDIEFDERWELIDKGKVKISGFVYDIKILNDSSFVFVDIEAPFRETQLSYKNDRLNLP